MAQPRKVAGAKPAARVKGSPARAARTPAKAATPKDGASGLAMTLALLILFCLVGALPTALGGEAFGFWRLPVSGLQLAAPPWSLTYDPPLAKPLPMVANATLRISTTPGGSVSVATLEPGFPVQVTRYATSGGVRWAQARWGGPTSITGGSGWTPASGLIPASGATSAHPIGDLGALSPTFGKVAGSIGPTFAASLYFPSNGSSYHTASLDQPEPLGAQIIPLLLTALYAKGIVAAQPNASNGPPPIAHDLVTGNAQALTFDYALVGDADGLNTFFTQRHINGFQFVAHQPTQAKGTARALALFYTALANGALTSATDRGKIISLLATANMAGATAIVPQSIVGAGALMATTQSADGGSLEIVTGMLTPASGPAVVVVAIAHGATAADTQRIMQSYFGALIPLMQG